MIRKIRQYLSLKNLLFFFALNAGWPSVFPFMGWLPEFHTNFLLVFIISVIFALCNRKYALPWPITKIIIIQLLCFSVYSLCFSDTSYLTRCMLLMTTAALLSIQWQSEKNEYIVVFVGWLTLQALLAIPGFILTLIGAIKPISTFIEFDGHTGQFFGFYTSTVVFDDVVRVAGFYDEPGAFAFWGIIALLCNKLFVGSKRAELIMIVGLITTLSMAYFIQIALYAYLFYRKKRVKLITYVLGFYILLSLAASFTTALDHAIFGRFEYDAEKGTLRGDNRSDLTETCLMIWKTSPIVGVGGNNLIAIGASMKRFVGANPLTFLAMDGVVGQIVLLLPLFLLFSLKRIDVKYKYAAIIIFVGFIQRPYDPTQLLYPLLILSMCLGAYNNANRLRCQ